MNEPASAFIWGANGAKLTPEQIALAREMLARKTANGIDTSPVGHWTQGAARVADALADAVQRRRLDAQEKAGMDSAATDFAAVTKYMGGSPSGAPSIPMSEAGAELGTTSPAKVDMTGNQVFSDFINTVKDGGVQNPYALAAIAATGKAESGFSPGNVNRTWDDPSASGQLGRAGGIMSWRGPRYAALAATGDLSPAGQARFFLQEDPKLIAALNNAKSVDEAQALMNRAWAFRGYDQPGGESARRLSLAAGFLPTFQGQGGGTQVASLDPSAGMPATSPIVPPPVGAPPPAPTPSYVDPRVTTDYRQAVAPPQTASDAIASVAPQQAAPALPPATTVATPPPVASVPMVAPTPAQGVQVAGSTGGVQAPNSEALIKAMSNPFMSRGQQAVISAMIQAQQARAQAQYEQQLKLADPAYQADLRLKSLQADQIANPRISPTDQANIDLNRDKFDFDRNKPTEVGGRLVGPDGKVIYEPPRDPMKVGPKETVIDGNGKVIYQPTPGSAVDFTDVSSLRKEIQQLPSYKNLSQALPIYRSMAETAGRSSKASDLNLVYGLGKIMDPTSVVREGEMTMVKNTASWPDWLQGAYAALSGGAALTPETREAIMREAYGRVQGYDSAFKQDTTQYQGIVERNKFNPADVIPDFGAYEPWKASALSAGPTQIQNVDDYRALAPGAKYIDPNGKLRTKQ